MDDDMVLVLVNRRAELGLTMADVAKAAGVSTVAVHSWEHRNKCPSLEHAQSWATALGYRLHLPPVRPRTSPRSPTPSRRGARPTRCGTEPTTGVCAACGTRVQRCRP